MIGYAPMASGLQWLGLAGFVLFWAAVITGIVLLIRYLSHGGQRLSGPGHQFWQAGHYQYPPPAMPTPEQILAERFARGEIGEAEFRQRMAVLRGAAGPYPGPPPPGPPPPGPPPPGPPPGPQPPPAS